MCLVEVEKAPKLVIGCHTPVAGRHGGPHRSAARRGGARGDDGVPAHQPPARLPDLRPGRASAGCRTTRSSTAAGTSRLHRAQARAGQGRRHRPARAARPGALHPVQPLHPLLRRGHGDGRAGVLPARRAHGRSGSAPGKRLDNAYSGNVVDICPVGALTLKEFRFKTRVWYLKNTPSICARLRPRLQRSDRRRGAQQEMMTTRGQQDDRIKRIVPRVNDEVNGHWMCDEGRLSFLRLEAGRRVSSRPRASGTAADYDDVVREAADRLRAAASTGRAGLLVGPRSTNETLYAWRRLGAALGSLALGVRRLERGVDDAILLRRDKGANSRGAEWIAGARATEASVLDAAAAGQIDTLVVLGDALDPADSPQLPDAVRSRVANVIYVGPFRDSAAEAASLRLPAAAWSEEDGTYVNFEGRVQRVRRGPAAGWRCASGLAHRRRPGRCRRREPRRVGSGGRRPRRRGVRRERARRDERGGDRAPRDARRPGESGGRMSWVDIAITLVEILVVANALMVGVSIMTWIERRLSGVIQFRWGPNRVGPFGLFQPLADGIKFLMKEDIIPRRCAQADLRARARAVARHRAVRVRRRAVRAADPDCRTDDRSRDPRSRRRAVVRPGRRIARRLRDRLCRLVLAQQVLADGRAALVGPDGLVRARARRCR